MQLKEKTTPKKADFLPVPLGAVVMTPGAARTLDPHELVTFLARHAQGDWGEVGREDWNENDFSLLSDLRLLSAYTSSRTKAKVWVITEADRSSTTILLPEEY